MLVIGQDRLRKLFVRSRDRLGARDNAIGIGPVGHVRAIVETVLAALKAGEAQRRQ